MGIVELLKLLCVCKIFWGHCQCELLEGKIFNGHCQVVNYYRYMKYLMDITGASIYVGRFNGSLLLYVVSFYASV